MKSKHMYLFNLILLLHISHRNGTKTKTYYKFDNISRTDNVTKTISVGSVSECAIRCLLEEWLCKSYNLMTVGGSSDKVCEFIGTIGGHAVPNTASDHYYHSQHVNCREQLVSGDIYSVGDASITASGYYNTAHVPSRGRLDSQQVSGLNSCWGPGSEPDRWIQADLGELMLVTGVLTRGRTDGAYIQWVTSYKFLYGETENSLEEYRE
ncbi:unnamed protein product, partial [Owenia fusiformis]